MVVKYHEKSYVTICLEMSINMSLHIDRTSEVDFLTKVSILNELVCLKTNTKPITTLSCRHKKGQHNCSEYANSYILFCYSNKDSKY